MRKGEADKGVDDRFASERASTDVNWATLEAVTERSFSDTRSVVVETSGSELVREMDEVDETRLEDRDFLDTESRLVDLRFSFFSGVVWATGSINSRGGVGGGVEANERTEFRDRRARDEERDANRGAPESSALVAASFCVQNSFDLLYASKGDSP